MPSIKVETVRINEQGQITLPESVRKAARVVPRSEYSVQVAADGSIVLQPLRDPEQAWFWTERWQAMEREADEEIAAGDGEIYDSSEAFLEALERHSKSASDADV